MMRKRLILSILIGLGGLLASFFIATMAATAWFQHFYPHDGQGGISAVILALYVAPVCGLAASAAYFASYRDQIDG